MKLSNRLERMIRTTGGLLVVLSSLWLVDALLLAVLASTYFKSGNLSAGIFSFLSFTVLGLLTVSLIKVGHRFLYTRFANERESVTHELKNETTPPSANDGKNDDHLFIRADGKIHKIDFNSILYAEAHGNYTKIVLKDLVLQPTITFTHLEKQLPKNRFIRVHRSFIVNAARIEFIEGNRVFIGKIELPIGTNYRDQFLKIIGISSH